MNHEHRTEHDSLGEVDVPAGVLWGAQTQRSLHFFAIGQDRFPPAFINAFALVKKAAALANHELGKLSADKKNLIVAACDEIIQGRHADQFPLSIWQTGSGTQTNMNLNEVIANRGNELAGFVRGAYQPLHPNDHVNMSQSSNDVFPTVMHVVCAQQMPLLLSVLSELRSALQIKSDAFAPLLKSGRTHLMDATPMTLGQEFSAFKSQLDYADQQLAAVLPAVCKLAIGGSAVGTGMNTHPRWAETVCRHISELAGVAFKPADNHFMALAAHEALLDLHGRLTVLATSLFKIASDIRLMNSGPRCGLSELRVPANEPGSSIMPGKVNPTQAEAMTMVCTRVLGNQTTIQMAASQGHFQLNVFKPVIIHTLLESMVLLRDAMGSFTHYCINGLEANAAQLQANVSRSLMLVTALSPVIGYEKAAQVARHADNNNLSLRDAVLSLGLMSADDFDAAVRPQDMISPKP
ncbi:MAG: class II fumarate hydratase [Gammaproteobacteria bacterium]|nr:class II fumarate hydratase [Gammaproteobacteria bacterium]